MKALAIAFTSLVLLVGCGSNESESPVTVCDHSMHDHQSEACWNEHNEKYGG